MNNIPTPEWGECFQSLARPGRRAVMTSLVNRFQPSDYRDMASICFPQLYVGDLVQILPSEVIDIIFAYCEPQDIFRLRNVSTIWNTYLSRPEFLQRMDHKMCANDGQYLLDSDTVHGVRRSFEDCVRHRCALSNGRACKFEHIQNVENMGDEIQFSSGTLMDWTYDSGHIYVKRLYREDAGWERLIGGSNDQFDIVRLTTRYILACAYTGEVYCWNSATLDLIAHFWLTSVPELVNGPNTPGQEDTFDVPNMIDASSNMIVMVNHDDSWFLYSLDKKMLTRVDTLGYQRRDVYLFDTHTEESGFLYVCEPLREETYIDVLKIDGTSSSISFVRRIKLSVLGRQQVGDAWDGGAAEDSRDVFQVIVVWNHRHMCSTQVDYRRRNRHELVYEMKDGILTYHHTIQLSKDRPNPTIYHPQMHMAFAIHWDSELRILLGLYQIYDKTCRPVSLGQSKFRSLHDINTVLREDLTDEDFDDIKWSVHANKEYTFSRGDSNFAIWILGRFTKVWRFYGIDESLFTTENTSSG